MYAFSNAACTVVAGLDAVSAGFGASTGFSSIPFGNVGFGFVVAGFTSAGFDASAVPFGNVGFGFVVAGFTSAGFTSAGFGAGVSNCEANLVNFASNSAILSSRFFFVFAAISYCKYDIVYLHFDQYQIRIQNNFIKFSHNM
jgi:hypothetical protein